MAKIAYSREGDLGKILKDFCYRANDLAVAREKSIMITLTDRILALTPVWEGDSIVNWTWSASGVMQHVETLGQEIPPGPTNTMPLGEEPRRGVNESPPRLSLIDALQFKKPTDRYFSNASDSIVDLEFGLLPTPDTSRSPRGIVRLAIKELNGRL